MGKKTTKVILSVGTVCSPLRLKEKKAYRSFTLLFLNLLDLGFASSNEKQLSATSDIFLVFLCVFDCCFFISIIDVELIGRVTETKV